MPKTVDEILKHAAELAARFERYEPDPADELDAGVLSVPYWVWALPRYLRRRRRSSGQ